jgi:hypothetical protein
MADRRVIRGSTYAASVDMMQHTEQVKMPDTRKKTTTQSTIRPSTTRVRTPDAVAGRKHMEIQTDNYLEELTDKPHEEDAATQTDAVMDRYLRMHRSIYFCALPCPAMIFCLTSRFFTSCHFCPESVYPPRLLIHVYAVLWLARAFLEGCGSF